MPSSTVLPALVTANGASFTSVRFTVTVSLVSVDPSPTSTVSVNTGVVSKSNAAVLFTVMLPALSMANAVPVLPAVMAKLVAASPVDTTVPTGVALALFSATTNTCPSVIVAGASVTFTVTVSTAEVLVPSETVMPSA